MSFLAGGSATFQWKHRLSLDTRIGSGDPTADNHCCCTKASKKDTEGSRRYHLVLVVVSTLREAIMSQKESFFTQCVKGGGALLIHGKIGPL